jgi:hypothetical protein
MITRIALAGLCVAAMIAPLGGCGLFNAKSGIPKDLKPQRCPPGQCDIEVSIVGNCRDPGSIIVKPELAEVADQDNLMRWVIVTKGYEFDRDGIDFPLLSPFKVLHSHESNVFRVLNRNDWSGQKDFKYDVNVKGCRRLDPWVRNN